MKPFPRKPLAALLLIVLLGLSARLALAQTEIEAAVRGTDEPQARLDQLHGSRGKDPVEKRPYARPKRERRHGRHWLAAGADDADVARPERETAIANVPGELRGPDPHRK